MKKIIFVIVIIFSFGYTKSQSYYELGLKAYQEEKDDLAIELFTKSIENNQELAKSYMMRASVKTILEKYVEAFSDINQSINLDSMYYKSYYYYGRIYFLQGFYSSALKYFDKAISMYKNNSDIYDERAICKIMLENFKGAIEDESYAIQLNSKNENYYLTRGVAKMRLNLFEDAIKDYDNSLNILPTQKAYANKGLSLSKLGKHSEAIKLYSASLSIYPEDKEVLYYRGLSYRAINKIDLACIDMKKSSNLGYVQADKESMQCK